MAKNAHGKRPTVVGRAVVKALGALKGRASGSVRVTAHLTGPAADTWRCLREAADGLDIDDSMVLALLLTVGERTVTDALLIAPREDRNG